MTDCFNKKKRSNIMSKIKCKDTKLEIRIRKALYANNIRYRKNSTKFLGKPDIINKKRKFIIFVNSCFWHGCSIHYRVPKSNIEYWRNKIQGNIKRDKKVDRYYIKNGWKIFRIWEHDLKNKNSEYKIIKKIISKL